MDLYPLNLNIANSICIIMGGGNVARRKVGELLRCGARVVIISPEVDPAILNMVNLGKVEWHARHYREGDLRGAFLVFAATDNREVQQLVAAEAKKHRILFNSVDDPGACSFQVPARVRRGDFLLTVSTGGGSPALAAMLRRQLAVEYGKEYRQLVDLFGRIRKIIITDGQTSASHKILFEKLLHLNILARIRGQEWAALERDLCSLLPDQINVRELIAAVRNLDSREND